PTVCTRRSASARSRGASGGWSAGTVRRIRERIHRDRSRRKKTKRLRLGHIHGDRGGEAEGVILAPRYDVIRVATRGNAGGGGTPGGPRAAELVGLVERGVVVAAVDVPPAIARWRLPGDDHLDELSRRSVRGRCGLGRRD